MNQRKHLTLVAAAAAFLGVMPLATVFDKWTWLVHAVLMVGALCGTAIVVRSLRVPAWAPTAAMAVVCLIVLTWLFPSTKELAAIVPMPGTFVHFNDLVRSAMAEMSQFAVPVDDRDGFLFLTAAGVGGVTILIDLFAVVLRRPALAGLPLLAIYSVPVAVQDESVSMLPFALGAAGFLWLLVTDNVDRVRRFGRRFTGDGRDVDLWEPSPLAAAGQRLGIIGIVAAILLPLAVPGMTTGLLDRFGTGNEPSLAGGGNGNGAAVSMIATLAGNLTRNGTTDYLKVTEVNGASPYYLRLGVAEELSAKGFNNKQPTVGPVVNKGLPAPVFGPGVTTKSYSAKIEVLSLDNPFLPIYGYPTKIAKLDSAWQYDRLSNTVFSTSGKQTSKKVKSYTIDYQFPEFNEAGLRATGDLKIIDPTLRSLLSHPDNAQVQKLVNDLTKDKTNEYDKIRVLADYFKPSNGFSYSTTTGPPSTSSGIIDFLFTNKQGFCVQYAAALGWLARAANYPSRVAIGFTRGNKNDGNARVLTNYNLHAWTEIYFKDYGWVPFDVTPPGRLDGSINPAWAPNPAVPIGNVNEPSDERLPTANPSTSAGTGANDSGHGADDPHPGLPQTVNPDSLPALLFGPVSRWTSGALILILLLAAPALRRLSLRRKRLRAQAPSAAGGAGGDGDTDAAVVPTERHDRYRFSAHRAWDELLDSMIDYRLPVDATETPRSTGERLAGRTESESAQDAARALGRAEERARYAREPLAPADLRTAVRSVRAALAIRATRRTRLMAALLPPSVTQRWARTISTTFTDLFNGAARRRDTAVRALSVRRLITRKATR